MSRLKRIERSWSVYDGGGNTYLFKTHCDDDGNFTYEDGIIALVSSDGERWHPVEIFPSDILLQVASVFSEFLEVRSGR